jgi:ceroid-lipofuscinosis MFS transporter 7
MLGGGVYFVASAWHGPVAIALIWLGRFLGGAGAANSTLGFTYIAQVIPGPYMTRANSLLSMVRMLGMTIAPALNAFLGKVDSTLRFGTFHVHLDPLNSVGLVLVLCNLVSFLVIYFLLEEPPPVEKQPDRGGDERSWIFWKHVLSGDVLVPIFTVFTINACFQLMETGLAPAAADALGWDPPQISIIFGLNSVVIISAVLLTFKLSSMGVTDISMMKCGLFQNAVGYGLIYFAWYKGTVVWKFAVPGKPTVKMNLSNCSSKMRQSVPY